MSEILYLNKIKVDTYNDKPITRNIRISDISEVDQIKSSYSYTIKLPKTSHNVQTLEMLGVIGNISRKPYEEIIADYVRDSIYLVENGIAIIRDSGKDFTINLIDGFKSLSNILSGKKLVDLPLDDLNHVLTTQNFIDSFDKTSGYIYAIANFGQGIYSGADFKVEKQAPSIFTHTLFRKIFESNGLNLIGEFFTTNNKYLNEVVTPSKGYLIEDLEPTETAKGTAETDNVSRYENQANFFFFEDEYTISDIDLSNASVVSGEIVISVTGVYRLDFTVDYNVYQTYLTQLFKINGQTKAVQELLEGTYNLEYSVLFNAEAGDVIRLDLQGNSSFEPVGGRYYVSYRAQTDMSLYLISGGQLITPSDYIGDVTQLDLVKDVVNRFGLVLKPLRGGNDFEFKRIEALLNDRENAEDWSDKIKSIESEDYISGYAKINKAKYKYPDEIVIPNNDGEMEIDNFNANNEKTLFESLFEIPNLSILTLGGNDLYVIPIWTVEDTEIINSETPVKVMNIERDDFTLTAKLFEEVSGITRTENIPILGLTNMSLQYHLNNFYKAFQNIIENFKKVTMTVNLSVMDIFTLDFFKLKYLKQTGRFYYLNSVQNTKDKISKVQALEIKEFLENLPPSQIGDYEFDMNHSTTKTITLDNLKTGYEDPELNEPYKIKIIDGFNTNLLIKQAGVTITSETEINAADLDLTIIDNIGGVAAFTETWTFAIADEGSKSYGTLTGSIIANVLEYPNDPPVADAGSDITQKVLSPPSLFGVGLDGSASYDLTGSIVSWEWEIIAKPTLSDATILQNTSTPTATLSGTTEAYNIGEYTLRLTVTDEFGSTDTDTMTVTIEYL